METLQAEVREGRGKGPARQLRAEGKAPAVLYGPGGDPVSLTIDPKELERVLTTPHRRNVLIEMAIGSDKALVMVKELQINPLTREVRHVDFYRVTADRPVKVQVPLHTKGRAKGVASGGKMRVYFRTVPVLAKASEIPAEIMVDVTPLDQNQTLAAKDLPVAEGVKVLLPVEQACVTIEGERSRPEGEEAEEAAPKKK